MKVRNKLKSKGFTLIELLVVISIIGMLSSIVLVSLQSARAKSRDAVRYRNLHEIRTAIELYRSNNNGLVPRIDSNPLSEFVTSVGNKSGYFHSGAGPCIQDPPGTWTTGSQDFRDLLTSGTPKYITSLPVDPVNDANYCYIYYATLTGSAACLTAKLEGSGNLIGINIANDAACSSFVGSAYTPVN